MTHRTVPLDLLVRVREVLEQTQWDAIDNGNANSCPYCMQRPKDGHAADCNMGESIAELTAQIEQQGQGEPVAWQYFDAGQWWPTSSIDKYPPDIPTRALYTTPQDSVPAWAWRQAYEEANEHQRQFAGPSTWPMPAFSVIESRALALAQG